MSCVISYKTFDLYEYPRYQENVPAQARVCSNEILRTI